VATHCDPDMRSNENILNMRFSSFFFFFPPHGVVRVAYGNCSHQRSTFAYPFFVALFRVCFSSSSPSANRTHAFFFRGEFPTGRRLFLWVKCRLNTLGRLVVSFFPHEPLFHIIYSTAPQFSGEFIVVSFPRDRPVTVFGFADPPSKEYSYG